MKKKLIVFCIICLLVGLDLSIKEFMINKSMIIIPNILSFDYAQNSGVAFGTKYNMGIIIIVSLLLIIGIVYFIIKNIDDIWILSSLILILAGAIGNIENRILKGFVVDYINVFCINFPVFNLADIFIVVGIILIFLKIFKKNKKST